MCMHINYSHLYGVPHAGLATCTAHAICTYLHVPDRAYRIPSNILLLYNVWQFTSVHHDYDNCMTDCHDYNHNYLYIDHVSQKLIFSLQIYSRTSNEHVHNLNNTFTACNFAVITTNPQTELGYVGDRLSFTCQASRGEKFWKINGTFAELESDDPYNAIVEYGMTSRLYVDASVATNNSVVTCWLYYPPHNEESSARIIVQGG